MTCIVTLRDKEDIILGADRCTSYGDSVIKANEPKITKRKIETMGKDSDIFIYMSLTGYSAHGSFLKYGFEIPKYDTTKPFKEYLYRKFLPMLKKQMTKNGLLKIENDVNDTEGVFCIIFDNNIYEIESSLGLLDVSNLDYYSIGSGYRHAEGSLYSTQNEKDAESRVKKSIQAAAHHLSGVDDNIDIMRIKQEDYYDGT